MDNLKIRVYWLIFFPLWFILTTTIITPILWYIITGKEWIDPEKIYKKLEDE